MMKSQIIINGSQNNYPIIILVYAKIPLHIGADF